jgi:hypothetical protein
MVTDYCQQDIALLNAIVETLTKINAERNGIDVHEDRITPELSPQAVVEPTCDIGAVLAAVGDENLGHGPMAPSWHTQKAETR